jgi:4-amino-4-deoxy-L-arabinose transferase-like glycosyltransferase
MLELAVFCAIIILSYLLLLRNFRFSIYVLLTLSVFLHKELFSFYKWDMLPIRAFMLAVFLVGLTRCYKWLLRSAKIRDIKETFRNPFLAFLSALWLVRGISIVSTQNLESSLFLFGFFTTIVILCFLLFHSLKRNPEDILRYLDFYILLVFGLTLFGYFQYFLYAKTGVIIGAFWNIPGNIPRIGATFWDVNHYGSLLSALLPLIGVQFLRTPNIKKRLAYLAAFLSLFATLLLTNSRTAWIMAFVSFITFLILLLLRRFGAKGPLYLLLALCLVSVPFVREYQNKASPFRAKIKHYFHYRLDSFDSHFMLLQGAYQVFAKYPILGGGYGGFFEHFSRTEIASTYFGRDPAAFNTRVPAHTLWGELIAETGVVGLSVFLLLGGFVLAVLYYSFQRQESWRDYFVPAVMFSVVVGWFVAGIFYSYNAEFFWIIFCLYFTYGFSLLRERFVLKNIIGVLLKSRATYIVVLSILGLGLLLVGLGKNHLVPWDEAIYAKIAKNMVVKHEYGVQYWWPTKVWYEKPPLYMWFMAVSMRTLGFTSFAARLPSALFGLATVFIVYNLGKKMFNKTVGYVAGLCLLTTVHFVYYSRVSMLDVMATFFITAALYCYFCIIDPNSSEKLSSSKVTRLWVLSGIYIGFSTMTKGVVGLLPLPIIFLTEIVLVLLKRRHIDGGIVRRYFYLVFAALGVLLPWHLYMYAKFGNDFLKTYIFYHVISRATQSIEDKGRPLFWYLVVLKVSMRLWFVMLLVAFPLAVFQAIKGNSKSVLLAIWALFTLTFFSVAKSKLVWYIVPLYPVLAIIVGRFVERTLDFMMSKVPLFHNATFKMLFLYGFSVFMLTYFFYNRGLVYTSDLTGSQARLLQLKDEKYGVDQKVYVDRIELPLILFYTEGPFDVIDFNPSAGRYPLVLYNEELVILGKRGRFAEDIPEIGKKPDIAGDHGDWVLWSYVSDYTLDKEALKDLDKQIQALSKQESTPAVLSRLNLLDQQRQDLTKKIEQSLSQVELLEGIHE